MQPWEAIPGECMFVCARLDGVLGDATLSCLHAAVAGWHSGGRVHSQGERQTACVVEDALIAKAGCHWVWKSVSRQWAISSVLVTEM